MMNNKDIFALRRKKIMVITLITISIVWAVGILVDYSLVEGFIAVPKATIWIVNNLVPNMESLEKLPNILNKAIETVLMSITATVIASVFALIASIIGSTTTKFPKIIQKIIRVYAAFFRNVPDVVWAMILMFSFGQNILTGLLALSFLSFGLLTRSFLETIDEASSDCVEALEATGANFLQIVFQGIIPSVMTGILTWILYMIETNIRASTLIGVLTATGIGYLFDMYYKYLDFGSVSLVVFVIILLVLGVEGLSGKIRKEMV